MASNEWTQAGITEWAHKTFGEPELLEDIVDRTCDEMAEFSSVGSSTYTDLDKLVDEAADVVIMLYQVMSYIGRDLHDEVSKKMVVNSKRSWVNTGAGVGQHI